MELTQKMKNIINMQVNAQYHIIGREISDSVIEDIISDLQDISSDIDISSEIENLVTDIVSDILSGLEEKKPDFSLVNTYIERIQNILTDLKSVLKDMEGGKND
jgi:hypothetical protein